MQITIYHNPKCSNSRGCLALIRDAGFEPTIIEYLKTPPSRGELAALVAKMGISPRELIRAKEAVYGELGLAEADDESLLDAMAAHPVLINRPIVVTGKGAALCRPPETVKPLLG
jgi:arsenate reductase